MHKYAHTPALPCQTIAFPDCDLGQPESSTASLSIFGNFHPRNEKTSILLVLARARVGEASIAFFWRARACARVLACVFACVRACVSACVRACVCVCVMPKMSCVSLRANARRERVHSRVLVCMCTHARVCLWCPFVNLLTHVLLHHLQNGDNAFEGGLRL